MCPNSKAYDKFWDSVSVERTLLDDRFQKGVKQGKEEGMAEGMKQGKEIGMNQRSLEIAKKMLANGMDAATVMEITGVTAEQMKLYC